MRLKVKEISGILLSAGFLVFAIGYAASPTGLERDHWDDGYMHGYYHGTSDGSQGEPVPDWLEDLRMD